MPKRSYRTATVIGVGKAGQGDSGAINQLLELLNRRGVQRVTLRSYSEYRSIVLSDRGSQYTVYTGAGVNTFDKGDVVVKCAKLPVGTEPLSDHDQRRVQASALYKEVAVLSHPRLRKHPNIVSLLWYDFVDLGNATFIPALIMEKATLGSLSALLETRNAGLDISARVDICSAITSGLLALHKADIAHGDVKPENVLMFGSAKAGVYVPKVADFGSAIILEPESGGLGRYYGTPSRNAPEVGNQTDVKLDREGLLKCDNYSLGLLIAQVMIGEWNSDWEAKSPHVLPAIIQRYSAVRRGADIAIDAVAIFHRLLPVEPKTRCSDISIIQQMFDPIGLEDISLAQVNFNAESSRRSDSFLRFRDSEDVAVAQKKAFGLSDYLEYDFDIELVAERDTQTVVFDRLKSNSQSEHDATSAKALFQRAIASALGFGTPFSEDDALHYAIASARKGYLPAMASTVAFHQALGRQSELDSEEAVDWLFEAVAWGSFAAAKSLEKLDPVAFRDARREFHKAGGYNQFFYSKDPPAFINSDEFVQALDASSDLSVLAQAAAIYGDSALLEHLIHSHGVDVNLTNQYGESLLVLACKAGHLDVLRCLVSSLVRVPPTEHQESSLHWLVAFDDGDVEEAASLLRHEPEGQPASAFDISWNHPSVDLPCRFPLGTPVHFCTFADDGKATKILVDRFQALLNDTGSSESTPLEFGLSRRKMDACRELIANGALGDPSTNRSALLEVGMNLRHETWVAVACTERDADSLASSILDLVLSARPELLDEPGEGGFTPLMGAAHYHDEQTVKALVARGCNVNAATPKEYDGRTALNLLTENKMQYPPDAILDVLIDSGVDLSQRSVPGGKHVFHFAARDDRVDIAERLLDLGVDVDIKTVGYGQTALHIAAEYGSAKVTKLLLQRGANVDAESLVGPSSSYQWSDVTPLMFAAARRRKDMLALLLQQGASGTAQPKTGRSVLHFAVTEADPSFLETLLNIPQLAARDMLDRQTAAGVTALHTCAAHLGRKKQLSMLLEAGANPNLRTRSGHSPLDCAHQTQRALVDAMRDCDEAMQANDADALESRLLAIAELLEPVTRAGANLVLRLGQGEAQLDVPLTTQVRKRDMEAPHELDGALADSAQHGEGDNTGAASVPEANDVDEDDPVILLLDSELADVEASIKMLQQAHGLTYSDAPIPEGLISMMDNS